LAISLVFELDRVINCFIFATPEKQAHNLSNQKNFPVFPHHDDAVT
jgi:hypothetical protein